MSNLHSPSLCAASGETRRLALFRTMFSCDVEGRGEGLIMLSSCSARRIMLQTSEINVRGLMLDPGQG